MKICNLLLIFGVLMPTALADFWIYSRWETRSHWFWRHRRQTVETYAFLDPAAQNVTQSLPKCQQVVEAEWMKYIDDLSTAWGVRCINCADNQNPESIEWNNEMGHFSKPTLRAALTSRIVRTLTLYVIAIYSNRDYSMVDTRGVKIGDCSLKTPWSTEDPGTTLSCDKEITVTPLVYCVSDLNSVPINLQWKDRPPKYKWEW